MGDGRTCIRLVTSWASEQAHVEEFLKRLEALL